MSLIKKLKELQRKRYDMETGHMSDFDLLDYHQVLVKEYEYIGYLMLIFFLCSFIIVYALSLCADFGWIDSDSNMVEKLIIALLSFSMGMLITTVATNRISKIEEQLKGGKKDDF